MRRLHLYTLDVGGSPRYISTKVIVLMIYVCGTARHIETILTVRVGCYEVTVEGFK